MGIIDETVSTYCQPVDRRIQLQWERVPEDGKIPKNAFIAAKLKTGFSFYIGRYRVDGETFSGPVLANEHLIYRTTEDNTVTINSKESELEVLVSNNHIQAEWVPLTNSQWPFEYTPIPCGGLDKEETLIGRVEDVGIGHVKIHASGLVCYIPHMENSKNGLSGSKMFTDTEFTLLCVK